MFPGVWCCCQGCPVVTSFFLAVAVLTLLLLEYLGFLWSGCFAVVLSVRWLQLGLVVELHRCQLFTEQVPCHDHESSTYLPHRRLVRPLPLWIILVQSVNSSSVNGSLVCFEILIFWYCCAMWVQGFRIGPIQFLVERRKTLQNQALVSRLRQPLCYIWRWISRKPLEIEVWFQRTTNRKWHMGYRVVTWPIMSRDLER